jgi:hypothetical protein
MPDKRMALRAMYFFINHLLKKSKQSPGKYLGDRLFEMGET